MRESDSPLCVARMLSSGAGDFSFAFRGAVSTDATNHVRFCTAPQPVVASQNTLHRLQFDSL